jgi:hypothetical protein
MHMLRLTRKTSALRALMIGMLGLGLATFSLGCSSDDDDDDSDTTMDAGPMEDASMADTTPDDAGDEPDPDTGEADTGMESDAGDQDPARAMIVHNSADPAASEVDVFLDGQLLIDNFAFRTALPFSDVPAGDHTVAIAGSDAGSEGSDMTLDDGETVLGEFDLTFESGGSYVAVATGVRPDQGFAENPDGEEIGLDLAVKTMAKEDSADDESTDELTVFHGVTDAPSVSARVDNADTPQIQDLTYGDFTNYLPIPAGLHTVDLEVAGDGTRLASLQTGELPGGQAWVVVASGFADPAANNDGEGLALVAFPAQDSSQTDIIEGTVLPSAARVQVVHAAPQMAVDPVDVWNNNSGERLIDDLAYESATPFVTLPAATTLNLGVAASDSESADDTLASQEVEFPNGSTNVVVASGVTNGSNFENVSDSGNFALRAGEAQESGTSESDVDLNVFHGATDAPTVDVETSDGTTVASGISFGSFSGIAQFPAADYTLNVVADGQTAASFDVPLSEAGGAYRTVVASGFLTAAGDPVDSSTFKLLAIAPDGSVTPITPNAN